MSTYGRGPNVSQYIASLNTIPQASAPAPDQLAFDDDLALFTESELFDFNLNEVKQENYIQDDGKSKSTKSDSVDYNAANFAMFGPSQPVPHLNTAFPNSNFDPQLFQSPQSATFPSSTQQTSVSSSAASQAAGQKRAHTASSPTASVEDNARMAAEEDKRRRNTAASARFRVKKKQREAALEKSARESADRVDSLQKRIVELEMENKWLRDLVVQKDGKLDAPSADTDAVPLTIAGKQVKKGVGTENTA